MENIFTSKASSAVLTQDLLDIQRLEHELGMEVEAVDDNIFHWKVRRRHEIQIIQVVAEQARCACCFVFLACPVQRPERDVAAVVW